jgi:hypothetical protein
VRRMPQRISPGARARRTLLFDFLIALAVAIVVLSLAAGLGVVGFFALPLFLIGLVWIGVEAGLRRLRRRGSGPRPARSRYP